MLKLNPPPPRIDDEEVVLVVALDSEFVPKLKLPTGFNEEDAEDEDGSDGAALLLVPKEKPPKFGGFAAAFT